jgi:hypothetical protein
VVAVSEDRGDVTLVKRGEGAAILLGLGDERGLLAGRSIDGSFATQWLRTRLAMMSSGHVRISGVQ